MFLKSPKNIKVRPARSISARLKEEVIEQLTTERENRKERNSKTKTVEDFFGIKKFQNNIENIPKSPVQRKKINVNDRSSSKSVKLKNLFNKRKTKQESFERSLENTPQKFRESKFERFSPVNSKKKQLNPMINVSPGT